MRLHPDRMNLNRLLLGILVVFVGIWLTDFITHGVLLKGDYAATAELWRSDEEMVSHMGWLLLGQLAVAVAFVTLWATGFAGRASVGTALMYGVLVGLFFSGKFLVTYAVQPVPGSLVFRWIVAGILQSAIMGLLVFAVCRPKGLSTGRSA